MSGGPFYFLFFISLSAGLGRVILVLILWCLNCIVFFGVLVLFYFSKKVLKVWGFECGAETLLLSYFAFSVQFYVVGLLFVVFDLEVIFMIRLVFGAFDGIWVLCFFVCFLLGGLFIELWGGTIC